MKKTNACIKENIWKDELLSYWQFSVFGRWSPCKQIKRRSCIWCFFSSVNIVIYSQDAHLRSWNVLRDCGCQRKTGKKKKNVLSKILQTTTICSQRCTNPCKHRLNPQVCGTYTQISDTMSTYLMPCWCMSWRLGSLESPYTYVVFGNRLKFRQWHYFLRILTLNDILRCPICQVLHCHFLSKLTQFTLFGFFCR